MILIISVCREKLSEGEFVRPVERLVEETGKDFLTKHYLELREKDVKGAEKIIICGTALMDFGYLSDTKSFAWIRNLEKPLLGICAGMQILGKVFGASLVDKKLIGEFGVSGKKTFRSYFLSTKAVKPEKAFEVTGKTGKLPAAIKHKERALFGCLFHPEVLNPEIITGFCANGQALQFP